jgi:hypothetical protein
VDGSGLAASASGSTAARAQRDVAGSCTALRFQLLVWDASAVRRFFAVRPNDRPDEAACALSVERWADRLIAIKMEDSSVQWLAPTMPQAGAVELAGKEIRIIPTCCRAAGRALEPAVSLNVGRG